MPHRVPALCILLASLILTSSLAAGAIYTVDGGGTGDYLTIGEALAVSSGGDVIQVFPGTYSENLTIGQAITLESTMGSALTTIVGAVTTSDVITITVDGVSIDGFTVTGGRYGLFLNAALTTITFNDCIVEETGSLPVSLPAQLVGSVIPTLTLVPHASGQYDGVNVTTGTIGSSVTWPVLTPGFVYYLSSVTVSVVGASGPVLTIPTGTIVKSWFSRFEIGSATLPGGLVADGVTFTSARDDIGGDTDGSALAPGAAEWQRLDFNAMARADSCLITNCDFYYGGSGTGAIQVAGSEPLINGCTFTDNAGAIYVTSSTGDGSTFVGNTINQGDYLPLGTTIDCLDNLVFGNTIVPRGDDVFNGIRLYNSTVTTSTTLQTLPHDFVYYMESVTISVVGPAAPVLTIATGSIVKMWFSRFEIASASDPGGLMADSVTFTSARDDVGGDTNGATYAPGPGQWSRIDFNPLAPADDCLLENCTFRYGGNGQGTVETNDCSPRLRECLIEQSSTSGLYTRGEDAYPSLWFCTLSDNNVGVLANYQGQAHIVRCCIEGNATYGVEVAAGSGHVASVDARNCWWGAADGPSGEGPGSGDAVTTVVRYDPWYTIPACSDMPSGIELPERFTLEGAYPNPFNPQTVIAFALPADLPVTVDVYTVDGQRVARLAEGLMNAGPCEVIWHGRNDAGRSVPSGVYLYRVQAGDEVLAGKMMMLK
jgi:hypothetical protein